VFVPGKKRPPSRVAEWEAHCVDAYGVDPPADVFERLAKRGQVAQWLRVGRLGWLDGVIIRQPLRKRKSTLAMCVIAKGH